MYRIVIRSSIKAPDVSISADNISSYQKYLTEFIAYINNPDSIFYLDDHYLLNRLVECLERNAYAPLSHCPMIFDSWSCFNSTPPGELQITECPLIPDLNYDPAKYALKECNEDGTWWVHPDSNRTWSNYTSCIDHKDFSFRNGINTLTVSGLSISLLFLLVSLTVFTVCKSLACGRITMHKNMFLSLTLNNISWLLWYHFVLFQSSVWSRNVVWCRALHIILNYFMLTTYFWMLCEGTYLQLLLINTFQVDEVRVRWLMLLGWGAPILIIIPYSIYRQFYENSFCWMEVDRESSYILGVPVLLVIIINIIFLSNVIRILRSKLSVEQQTQAVPRRNSSNQATLKQARAALFLVPILGVYFLLTPVRPSKGSSLEYAYEILSAVSSSFQGFFVSILLCFTNSEVLALVKQRLNQFLISRRGGADINDNSTIRKLIDNVPIPRLADGALTAGKVGAVPIMQSTQETSFMEYNGNRPVQHVPYREYNGHQAVQPTAYKNGPHIVGRGSSPSDLNHAKVMENKMKNSGYAENTCYTV